MSEFYIKRVDPSHEDLHKLIAQLDTYLFSLYPPEEVFTVDFKSRDIEKLYFVVAYIGVKAVGCGAINILNDHEVELKRFYVEPTYRNRGIAANLLQFLEQLALDSGHTFIKLETGEPQFESIRFYTKAGFKPIDKYGDYIDSVSSVCLGKALVK